METKKCSVCGITKGVDEFFKRRVGHDNRCKVCRLSYNRDRYQRLFAPYRKKYEYGDVEVKVCTKCQQEKPVAEFNLHHSKSHGYAKYRSWCKRCESEFKTLSPKVLESRKLYNITHAEELKRKKREYLSIPENLEKSRAYAREYNRKYPERQRDRLFKKYGITAKQYDEMLSKQNGGCAICGTQQNGRKKNFIIDHDHKTGRVRALLCTQCNAGLGNYRDDPELMFRAAQYLKN